MAPQLSGPDKEALPYLQRRSGAAAILTIWTANVSRDALRPRPRPGALICFDVRRRWQQSGAEQQEITQRRRERQK